MEHTTINTIRFYKITIISSISKADVATLDVAWIEKDMHDSMVELCVPSLFI